MKTIKPQKLGVLCKTFEDGDACRFAVSVLVFFPFAPPSSPLAEVDLWKFVASELGDEPVDAGMPKVRGEVIVSGSAYPFGGPRTVCAPRVAIGKVDKVLYVVGDRFWKGGATSEPRPFTEMPITWERAFGGEGYAENPVGKGVAPVSTPHGEIHFLPNVEDPKRLVRTPADRSAPAGFGPYDFTWPQRFSKIGTYDAEWLKERFPGFAEDLDWSIWNTAPEDQQIAGWFHGDEAFTVEHMHPEKARIEGRLPGVRARVFITQKTGEGEAFREIPTRLDTVRLFPRAERGVLVFRGVAEVAEDDAADVLHLVLGCEDLGEAKAVDHYREVLARRLDRKTGAMHMLRERDLLPAREGLAAARSEDGEEMAVVRSNEGLIRKHLRRRAEAEHEQAKQRMIAHGVDPARLPPPPPPEEPAPALDDLAEHMERLTAEADRAKADAEKKRAEAEQEARARCAAQGVDYDKAVRDAEAKAGGPPKFSAEAEIAKLKDASRQAKGAGAASPEVDALLSDPDLEERLRATEKQLRDAYRKFAHHQPAAARLEGEPAARARSEVVTRHRAGKSFACCDLTGADLSGLDLTKADFWGALLEHVDFSGSELGGADFRGAVLARADLTRANLFAAKLAGANLGAAKLVEAEVGGGVDLTGAVLAKADLTGARFQDAKMERVDLSEAVLAGADFSRAVAPRVNFIKTDLAGVKLGGADMSKCNFIESRVAGVDFTGAKLVSAVFVTATGDDAVFRDADLTNVRVVKGSSFERADFRGAKLASANLRGTKLAGSDFSGSHLDGAHLSECDLRGARFYRAVAKGAQLIRADLTGAVMTSINLMDGSLQKATLDGADLRGANLFGVDFARSYADGKTNLEDANVKRVRIVPPRKRPPRPPAGAGAPRELAASRAPSSPPRATDDTAAAAPLPVAPALAVPTFLKAAPADAPRPVPVAIAPGKRPAPATMAMPAMPAGPVLPFVPASDRPPAPEAPPAHVAPASSAQAPAKVPPASRATVAMSAVPTGPALPFAPAQRASPSTPPPADAASPEDEASARALMQSIERYASLCVDLARAPAHAAETLAHYRITAEQRAAIDEHWRARMSDAATRARWDEACRIYRAWLATQGR